MSGNPTLSAAERAQQDAWAELQAKWHDWAWKIAQRSDDDADAAEAALLDAIDAHHRAMRILVGLTLPIRARSLTNRPATADEITYPRPSPKPRPAPPSRPVRRRWER